MRKSQQNILIAVIFPLLFAPVFWVAADTQSLSDAAANRRAQLEVQLRQYEAQIDQYQNLIDTKRKEGDSLKRDIDILDTEILKTKIAISASKLNIGKLSADIDQKSKNIDELAAEIQKATSSISETLRQLNQHDNSSAIELALVYDDLSGFFGELESIKTLQTSLKDSLDNFTVLKNAEEKARDDLEDQKSQETQLKAIQELQQKSLKQNESEKQGLLKETKGKESEYQKILQANQKNAANIRSQLFLLVGSPSIPFEKALSYAMLAQKATGIRPAFLLGLITEESNLGQNIGTGNWQTDLANSHCAKQRTAFVQITSELGVDPNLMPVSKKAWYGYCGGAMGPAQFMPATWLLYKDQISGITGHRPASPWEAEDSLVGAALLLEDNGATGSGANAEWVAAMKYLAGSNWKKSAYRFYGDDVMAIAVKYQDQINILQGIAQR